MIYNLPTLKFSFDALEPHLDRETMSIHYEKHHQAYIDNLNKAIIGTNAEHVELVELLKNISNYPPAVRNNAGGHYNHSLYWSILSPKPQSEPTGEFMEAIKKEFGTLEDLKKQMKQAGLGQFGSGWVWLLVKYNGSLAISSTPNQDNPLMDTNTTSQGYPILGIDVWEHSYYLKYQNRRADYLDSFWSVLDWAEVEKNYQNLLE